MNEKIFTEIPMRTWRWLGVNEAVTNAAVDEKIIEIADNETRQIAEVNLSDEISAKKIKVIVGNNAKVDFTFVDLGSTDSFSEIIVELDGDDSVADVAAVYFGNNDRKIDMNYIIKQTGKRTDATMNVRGALSDNSEKIFRGTLDFKQGSKGSVGRESEEVVILSPTVRNRSVPLMLSHEDDVDGHHAVSVGRIDENKLFYLMSRGLDKVQAEKLIVEASFNPVIDRISDDTLRIQISDTIQRRLTNNVGS